MRYSTKSKETRSVLNLLGWRQCGAVETATRGDVIYVRGTLLKPSEVAGLQACDGQKIDQYTCKLMNFRRRR